MRSAVAGEASIERVSEARGALIAVIDAKQARRPSAERRERRGRPCPHDGGAGGRGRDAFMKDARGRGVTAMSAGDEVRTRPQAWSGPAHSIACAQTSRGEAECRRGIVSSMLL